MSDFETELKMGFLEEAKQLLTDAEQCFLALEENPNDQNVIEKIFRIAHNIKGSSKAVGFDELGAFTHEFENFLLKVKGGEVPVCKDSIDLLLKGNDQVKIFIEALSQDVGAKIDSSTVFQELKAAGGRSWSEASASAPAPTEELQADPTPTALPVDVPPAEAFAEEPPPPTAEEVAVTPAVIAAPTVTPPAPSKAPTPPKAAAAADESIRVSLHRLEKLLNFVGELVILQTVLNEQSQYSNSPLLKKTINQMKKVTKEIQEVSMGLRMLPLKTTFQKMQRIVRDTSALLGKKVLLQISGDDTEVDKTILESLGDPLVHLIRNAVDHGIESAEERAKAGKPEQGLVKLSAYHQGGRLIIEIVDDGGGIHAEVLKKKAIEKGILKQGVNYSEKELVHLIFHAGFSTKAVVTEVSGRGVGMDVVKTNIESIGGEILLDTAVGKGTSFKISLPLTLAIIDGVVVSSVGERFVVPISHIKESVRISELDIQRRTGVGEVLLLRGETLPAFRLWNMLGKKPTNTQTLEPLALIINVQNSPFAVLVDDLLGQQEVVIKKLGQELQKIKGYAGSAVLGDGKPALILELGDLVERAVPLKIQPVLARAA